MNDEEQRFIAETGEEAHYWFTVSDVARLSVEQGLATVLSDVIELMHKEKMKGAISG